MPQRTWYQPYKTGNNFSVGMETTSLVRKHTLVHTVDALGLIRMLYSD